MRTIIWAAGLAVLAGQANALSCNFGNTASAWAEAQQQGDEFITVQGTFQLPEARQFFEEEDYVLSATFEGIAIAADGTITPMSTSVKVIGACINGDCGYLGPDIEMVTFLHKEQDVWVTYSNPCSSYPLGADTHTMDELVSCMTGGDCIPEFAY